VNIGLLSVVCYVCSASGLSTMPLLSYLICSCHPSVSVSSELRLTLCLRSLVRPVLGEWQWERKVV